MSILSKLKLDKNVIFLSVIFYGITGLIFLTLLPFSNYPPHISLIGIFSLITAYGLVKNRFYVIWLVFTLFSIVITFSIFTLYYFNTTNLYVSVSIFIYMFLTGFFTFYINAKLKKTD